MFAGVTELSSMESLMIAFSGLAIVFMVLGCLALLIQINAKVIGTMEARKKPLPGAGVTTAPVVNPQEDEELVAVLVAAIAAETETNPGDFTITSIKEG